MPRNLGALFCGMAAVALLVAGFMPWFATQHDDDDSRGNDRSFEAYLEAKQLADDDSDGPTWAGEVRGNFGLVSGETCVRLTCTAARYTGARGLADDAFAWLGRATLGAALAGVALLITTALAARSQRRPILRGWAVTVVATAAGLGAAFAAAQTLDEIPGYLQRGMGLGAVITGAALAGLGAAWPWGPRGDGSGVKRVGLALAVAVLALLAWFTLAQHAWWRSGRTLDILRVSPLGVEVCDGGDCRLSTALGARSALRVLAAATSLCVAAMIAPAFGAASRIARGIAPGPWAWATAVLAGLGLAAGLATWASYPSNDVMAVSWGLPVFALAMAGSGAAAVAAAIFVRSRDLEGSRVHDRVATDGAVAPGARPVLAALGAAGSAAPAAAEPDTSRYAPRPEPVPTQVQPQQAQTRSSSPPTGPTTAALLAKRTSPMCPTCRVATLWHSKRGAWWCSTCKQNV